MSIKRIFIAMTAIFAASAVFADNSSVTSKKYVDDLMSGYQGKLPGSGANKLMTYDDEDGIGEKEIVSTLGNSASATTVPTVGAVKTGLDGKQDTITGTAGYVMTGTGTPGEVGEKPIYSANTNYSDSLVTAETVNTGVINAVNSSLIRVDEDGTPDSNGTLWKISDDLWAINAKVPYGYTELQYIESTGTQYIDTGFVPNADYTHKIVFNMLNTGTAGEYLCGTNTTYGRSGNVKAYNSEIVGIYVGKTSAAPISIVGSLQTETPNTLVMNLKSDVASEVFLNGTNISNAVIAPSTSTSNLYLFNLQAISSGGSHARIYSDQIYQNGSLVRDFIPASKVENNVTVVGMYDTITGQFFTNPNGNNFIAGPSCISPNLFDGKSVTIGLSQNRCYVYNSTPITSPYTTASAYKGWGVVASVKPNTTYAIQAKKADGAAYNSFTIGFYKNEDDVTDPAKELAHTSTGAALSFTTPENCNYVVVGNYAASANTQFTWKDVQLEAGSTATAYRPYGENICN